MVAETVVEPETVVVTAVVPAPEAVQEIAAAADEAVADPALESAITEAVIVSEAAAVATPEAVQEFAVVAEVTAAEPTPTVEPETERSAIIEAAPAAIPEAVQEFPGVMEETVAESASVGEAVAVAAPEARPGICRCGGRNRRRAHTTRAPTSKPPPLTRSRQSRNLRLRRKKPVAEPTVDSAITEPAAVATPEPVQEFVAVAEETVVEPTPRIEPEIEQSAVYGRCFRSRFRSSAGVRCSRRRNSRPACPARRSGDRTQRRCRRSRTPNHCRAGTCPGGGGRTGHHRR